MAGIITYLSIFILILMDRTQLSKDTDWQCGLKRKI
jgi:hypothetical protein